MVKGIGELCKLCQTSFLNYHYHSDLNQIPHLKPFSLQYQLDKKTFKLVLNFYEHTGQFNFKLFVQRSYM